MKFNNEFKVTIMELNEFLEEQRNILYSKGELYWRVKARPNAEQTAIKEVMADKTVKIDIAAPAQKNRANQELMKFLAKEFAVSKNNVKIISGQTQKVKLIKISNK